MQRAEPLCTLRRRSERTKASARSAARVEEYQESSPCGFREREAWLVCRRPDLVRPRAVALSVHHSHLQARCARLGVRRKVPRCEPQTQGCAAAAGRHSSIWALQAVPTSGVAC